MRKIFISTLLVFISIPMMSQSQSKEVGKVKLPTELMYNKQNLILNGSGIRSKWFFNIYTIGLYLNQKNTNPQQIIEADETMGVRFEVTSKLLSRAKFASAFEEGFQKSTNGNIAQYRSRIQQFFNLMHDEIRVGNVYDVIYHKGIGTSVYYEGEKRGTIKGLDFKQALMGVWLSDLPANKRLKKELLALK